MIFEYFPDEIIALNRELATGLHPKLNVILTEAGGGADDIDLKLAQIAAYCEVLLDGDYTLESRMNLCKILTKKLIEKRERPDGIIILNS